MNKAVPWSVKGVASEAREAAREAARRSGLSIGEWLNSVIAEQAADSGVEVDELDDQTRLEAVTARLARISGRMREPPMRYRRGDRQARPHAARDVAEEVEDEDEVIPVRRGRRPAIRADVQEAFYQRAQGRERTEEGDSDDLFERALRALERESRKSSEATLAALDRLGERLAGIERRVADPETRPQDPVRQAIARLEERLSDIGAANSAEQKAASPLDRRLEDIERRLAERQDDGELRKTLQKLEDRLSELAIARAFDDPAEAFHRLDRKIESIGKRIQEAPAPAWRHAPQARLEDAAAPLVGRRDGVHRAVAEIARRQRALDLLPAHSEEPLAEGSGVARLVQAPQARGEGADLSAIRRDLEALSKSVQGLHPSVELEKLSDSVRSLADRIEGQSAPAAPPAPDLREAVEDLRRAAGEASRPIEALRKDVSEIAARLEALPAQSLDAELFQRALAQAQEIRDLLATTLARQSTGPALERRLEEIVARIENLEPAANSQESVKAALSGLAEVRDALTKSAPQAILRELDDKFEDLSRKLDRSAESALAAQKVAELDRRLESFRRELSERLDRKAQDESALIKSLKQEISSKLDRPLDLHAERLESLLQDVAERLARSREPAPSQVESALRDMEAKIATLADKSVRESQDLREAVSALASSLERAPQDSAASNERIDALLNEIADKLAQPGERSADRFEQELSALAARVEELARGLSQPSAASAALAEQVSRLTQQASQLRGSGPDEGAFESLRAEIAELSQRLQTSEAGLRAFADMEVSLNGLVDSLADSHEEAVQAARDAARDVAAAMIHPKAPPDPAIELRIAELREAQDAAEQRIKTTLGVVHDTLEKVVDRLARVESVPSMALPQTSLASGPPPVFAPARERAGRPPSFEARPPERSSHSLEFDELIEPGSGFAPSRAGSAPEPRPAGRSDSSDFIAAARRAISRGADARAQGASDDPESAKARARAAAARLESEEGKRPGPAARLLHMLEQRRRPILYGLAAVALALCSLQLVGAFLDHPSRPKTSPKPPVAAAPPTAAPGKTRKSSALELPRRSASSASKPVMSPLPTFARPMAPPPPALVALEQGASRGDPGSQFALGVRYAEGNEVPLDPARAFDLLRKAADQNVPAAAYRVGLMYERGVGVARDPSLALHWYRRAARAGNARAMHNLAVLTAQIGDHGGPDYAGAASWFARAAKYGVRDSQYNLAILYARGMGLPRSLQEAYVWFALAAEQGDADAAAKRDEVAARLPADQLRQAKAQVAAFRPLTPSASANQGPAPEQDGVSAARGEASPSGV